MIPKIDLQALIANDTGAKRDLLAGIQEYGFLIVHNTSLSATDVVQVTDSAELLTTLGADAQNISLLYGGSVKGSNADDIFSVADVDGALVGGASLYADDFVHIIKALARA